MKKYEETPFILPFSAIRIEDIQRVGGKNASIGEMISALSTYQIKVPDGFAITIDAYWAFIDENKLKQTIEGLLGNLDPKNTQSLQSTGKEIRQLFLGTPFPLELKKAISSAYKTLCGKGLARVAVRSSATAEDLPQASFAGQLESYLHVVGEDALLKACKKCFASLFTDRAISYRSEFGFDHLAVGLSVGVQRMIRSDQSVSGVMFTIDTESGFNDAVLINASYGLGEAIVQGRVTPDEYLVFKPTLKMGFRPIIQKSLGTKESKLVYLEREKAMKTLGVSKTQMSQFALSDDEILKLSRWGMAIEEHYSKKYGRFTPMDIEWGKDGKDGDLFILQARPETIHRDIKKTTFSIIHLKEKGKVLVEGRRVGEGIAHGRARVINDIKSLHTLKEGEILVTDNTDPDWEPVLKRAAAIVTDRGGRTCHAAIVSRELGIASIVGTKTGTRAIKTGQEITVSSTEGDVGRVYEGTLKYEEQIIALDTWESPKTAMMMILGNPDEAFKLSFLPNDGVGLMRIEFVITNAVRIHPMALLHFDQVSSKRARAQIKSLTRAYKDHSAYFVDKLSEGMGKIAAAFYPKDVIVRMSDFKSNEYANLIGGSDFEIKERNPMIGFRGASRYYDERYKGGFELECQAIKRARDDFGLKNIKVMIPFCRTLEEGIKVISLMDKFGLKRDGLQIYVMCEIPSNVILAKEFADIFDGFSIGSNDLTQLTLGIDRDSELLAHLFDERNQAVRQMISMVIKAAHEKGRKIGICGQAPSDYPEYVDFLVEQGIDSISLVPDVLISTSLRVLKAQKRKN